MKVTFESFINLNQYEQRLNDLINKIKNNKSKDDLINQKKDNKSKDDLINQKTDNNSNNDFYITMEKIKKKNDFQFSTKRINALKEIINKLSQLEPDDKFIKGVVQEYDDLVNYINKDKKIRIAILGLYSSGKSTILNTIIGKKILPTSSDECTRRGIIIRYHNKNIPELYKTKFIKKSDYYFFEDSNEPVCSGFDDVKEELIRLNKINEKFQDSIYILIIKIEF